MQFKELWSALLRRWYVVLVVLALATAGGFGVVKLIGPTYKTQGAVLILPPGTSGTGPNQTVGNPFLSLAGVSQVRDVVIRTIMSKTFLEEVCATSGDADYEQMTNEMCHQSPSSISFQATPDFTSSAPLILVTVDSKSPTTGAVALRAVVDRVPGILTDLQSDLGLRRKSLVTSTPVVMDLQPDVVHKKQIRAALLVGAGILGLGLLAVALIDSMLMKRQRADEAEDLEEGVQTSSRGATGPPEQSSPAEEPDPADKRHAAEEIVESSDHRSSDSGCADVSRPAGARAGTAGRD